MSETPETPETIETPIELTPAEQEKKLGNDAFAARKYDEAITHYTNAIKIDPTSPIYFSNRSACYSFKHEWENALSDAKKSIELDSKFIKGYFRLASAQAELKQFDDGNLLDKIMLLIHPIYIYIA